MPPATSSSSRGRSLGWTAAWAATALSAALCGQAQLVADLNVESGAPGSSNPDSFVRLGSDIYFAASAPLVGRELFTANAQAGARLRRDVVPGTASSNPRELIALGNRIAFVGDLGSNHAVFLFDPATGTSRSGGQWRQGGAPRRLVASGSSLFFFADDGVSGLELWVWQPDLAPTPRRVADLNPLGSVSVASMVAYGNGVAAVLDDGTRGFELWVSDGTAAGTRIVSDFNPGPAWGVANTQPLVVGSLMYLGADNGLHGNELCVFDGTSIQLVVDFAVGSEPSFPQLITQAGSRIGFVASGGFAMRRLVVTDGTAAGTRLVANVTNVDNLIGDPSGRLVALASGTSRDIAVVDPGAITARFLGLNLNVNVASPVHMVQAGGLTYFTHFASGLGQQLRVTDGTTAGSRLLVEGTNLQPTSLVGFADGSLFFAAGTATAGRELWYSDGSTAGTSLFADIDTSRPTAGSLPVGLGEIGGRAILWASSATQRSLVATDGTRRGTVVLRTIAPNAVFETVASLNDSLLVAESGSSPRLVRTDGTPGGTAVIANVGLVSIFGQDSSAALDGERAVFAGSTDQGATNQLWITDGTSAGTRALATLDAAGRSLPFGFQRVGNQAYFLGGDGNSPDVLWRTDGTSAGTVRVSTAHGARTPRARMLGAVGDRVVFAAFDAATGLEPWITDNSPAGARLLADLTPGIASTFFEAGSLSFASRLLFRTNLAIIATDGTGSGTVRLPYAAPDGAFAALGDLAYVVGGTAIVRTDGTVPGTAILPVALPSGVNLARRVSDSQFAIAVLMPTADEGLVLLSDGTAAGTSLVAANAAGRLLSPIDGALLFAGTDAMHGVEPWILSVGATAQPVGEGCGPLGTRVRATDPRLGAAMAVRAEGLGALSALLLGQPAPTPVRQSSFGVGCALFVDPSALVLGLPASGALDLSVPANLDLEGVSLCAQVATVTAVPSLALSNGVRLTLGQ